ncbi:branched-chain-amino-acid aminotransferase [Colletotrichum salicis]|uniref:Branched-chain-amino-acid aminotransferase n=1 Tax=Colletotrichum salicis TaxID=1209931 RepID=A0A135SFJ6_9PEZI|nr:branched-chain-amino-acid aminotransferase [Colletotrichum salicis]
MSPSATSTSPAILQKASGQFDNERQYTELDASEMLKELVPAEDQLSVPDAHDPVRLGQNYTTAHMVQVPWSMQTGWGTPVMSPYGKIALEPTASVLHYATESFTNIDTSFQPYGCPADVYTNSITRRSVLEIAKERLTGDSTGDTELAPLEVVERPFTMGEVVEAYEDGRLVEAFVSGTAMFITPVSMIKYGDTEIQFPMTVTEEGHKTPRSVYSSIIKSWLEDIIYGRVEHEWGFVVSEE